ncbi:hypothetical protein [Mesorhizobium sp. M8A.F.Ca.ET.021.01.1.1]|uniref:hypothetical protein n=1 Tax=Mesorhizobium sp. M8A.F.Ca.ET.021.01.1.1 TaxID=2496757 RepID=UPI000FCA5A2F|nr:hypothetical protein [Mesorhizobium sp. M8A.F.Ca.ET.021.01.1.1]RUW56708.1 hypothetical protein EOA36_02670 [Mesorhizobium sp. M8A.F.Ca.ET.021.01.1.1]
MNKKPALRFELDNQFSIARRKAVLAGRNANQTRVEFRGEFVTHKVSVLSRLADLIKGVLSI